MNARFAERLRILKLAARVLVVEFVAEGCAIGSVFGKAQFLHKHQDDLVDRRIVRKFHGNALVLRRVVDRNVDGGHSYWESGEGSRVVRLSRKRFSRALP